MKPMDKHQYRVHHHHQDHDFFLSNKAANLYESKSGMRVVQQEVVHTTTSGSKGKEPMDTGSSSSSPPTTAIVAVDKHKPHPPPRLKGEYDRIQALNNGYGDGEELGIAIRETLEMGKNISQDERRLLYENVTRLRKMRPPRLLKREYDELIEAIDYQAIVGSGLKSKDKPKPKASPKK